MESFFAENGSTVLLSEESSAFEEPATHVLVICSYKGKWLLTDHKKRGFEFPGGKMEKGERIEDAAVREVFEETGGKVEKLTFLGEYKVTDETSTFVKAIFYGEVEELALKPSYLETNGPVLVVGDILKERFENHYSFVMKDRVVEFGIKKILQLKYTGEI